MSEKSQRSQRSPRLNMIEYSVPSVAENTVLRPKMGEVFQIFIFCY